MDIINLQVKYGDTIVIDNLSFRLKEKEIVGIIGQNGAGKTTLINTIVGLKDYCRGEILLSNSEKNIGFLPDSSDAYDYLTGREFLSVLSDLKKFSCRDLKELVSWISNFIDIPDLEVPLSALSKGNLEKVMFIQSFINRPKILVLDEPFSGFDSQSVVGAKKILSEYTNKGNSIILSTHIIEMCSQICNRVIMLKRNATADIIELKNENTIEQNIKILEGSFLKP